MSNALTTTRPSLLMDPQAFDHMQRVGKMLALSPLFPDHLRKGSVESAIANGVLVMNMASRLNEDPLTVAQNIYFVSGKPGWSASYMIGKANQHGVFRDPIDWEVTGSGDTLSVTAFAVLAATGKRVSVTCDMAMAKAEGWTSNKKYQSMPRQMLCYRSGTFLIRLYCPEVMIGVPAAIEHELAMKDVTPDYMPDTGEATGETKAEPEEAEVADPQQREPAPAPRQRRQEKPREDATPYVEQGRGEPAPETRQPAADPKPAPVAPVHSAVLERIRNDLLDIGDPDEVLNFYHKEVAAMEREAPALHGELLAEVEAMRQRREESAAATEAQSGFAY